MKFTKYLFVLAFAFCALSSITNAQNVLFLGAGSSALFQELGQAAYNISNATAGQGCLWTSNTTTTNPPAAGSDYFAFRDQRPGGIANNGDENGKLFVAWNTNGGTCAAPTAGYNIYAYMQLDSVLGDRCYFENDGSGHTGCLLIAVLNGATGANQISTQADVPAAAQLPAVVQAALLAGATKGHSFVAGTDIRPEDALFATQRALAPCNKLIARQFFNDVTYDLFGFGYGGANANIGVQIQGDGIYGGGTFNVVNFNITGNDPITSAAVPGYAVNTVGAQPVIVVVGPTTDGAIAQMTDITAYTLSQFYAGNNARTTDLYGVTVAEAMDFLEREGLSGTFNTFEYSMPQSTQFHTGQLTSNCNAGGTVLQNPMQLDTAPGVFGAGVAYRATTIGTGNMVKFINAPGTGRATLGYYFWSAGNAKPATASKYLKVNGIDPLLPQIGAIPAGCTLAAYAYNGVLPGTGIAGDPGLSCVNFASLNAGDYPIWSNLRLVAPVGDPGTANMITALDALTHNDFIKHGTQLIWHSHFQINGQPANANNGPQFCAGSPGEGGGDVGGSTMLGINDTHFCSDFSVNYGKLNLTF